MIQADQENFSKVAHFLRENAETIYTRTLQKLLSRSATDIVETEQHAAIKADIIIVLHECANSIEDVSQGIGAFERLAETTVQTAMSYGLTLETAIDEMLFLRQVLWEKLYVEDVFHSFTTQDLYTLNQRITVCFDLLCSKIASFYHDYYIHEHQKQAKIETMIIMRNLEALEKSEERFRMMADNIENLAWIAQPDGWIYWYNKRWYDYTGTTTEDMEGWGWQAVHDPEQLSDVLQRWNVSIQTGEPFQMVFPLKGADGTFRPFLTRVMPVKDSDGNVLHWFGTNTDITEQKETEKKLSETLALLELLLSGAPVGFAFVDQTYCYRQVNTMLAEDINGRSIAEHLGKTVEEVIGQAAWKDLEPWYEKARQGEIVRDIPLQQEHSSFRSSERRYVLASLYPVRTDEEMLGVGMVVNDITTIKRAEEAWKDSEAKLSLFVESNVIGFLFGDIYGNISYANDALLMMVGYSRQEFAEGKVNWAKITPAEWLPIDEKGIAEAQAKGSCTPYQKEYFRKDGSRVNVLIGFILLPQKKEQSVAFVLDITENKRLERQKDEFIAVASHELKTPVTSLKAYTQILQKVFKNKGDLQSFDLLTKMNGQINKLITLITDLLDVSKIQAGKLQLRLSHFDFNGLVTEIVDEIQRTTSQHTIHMQLADNTLVYCDRERVGQVITNLLTNAVKYSPSAESVIVRTQHLKEEITLSIQDFGIGISREKQEKVFERFYRVEGPKEDTYPGLGLGLYISREIIRRHGGAIWVESVEGKGSTFYFTLPTSERILQQPEKIITDEVNTA